MRQHVRRLLAFTLATGALGPALAAPATAEPQTTPAAELLERSIAYHDPDGRWANGAFRIEIAGTRPLAGATLTSIVIDNAAGRFSMQRERNGRRIETTVTGNDCWTTLDGSSDYSESDERRFGLGCDAMKRQRDYHLYLYGLPMKLRDAGVRLDPDAQRVEFEGRDVWQLRVTYDPEVGTDTWHFFLGLDTAALVGYRFNHDEAANDGETIVLDREIEGAGLRLPKVRSWTRNADGELLGTDVIQSIEWLGRE